DVSTLGAMLLAERVGFEPTVTRKATTVFETAPFSHSGTSPNGKIITEKLKFPLPVDRLDIRPGRCLLL
ncbi:MAG: hypothetical protein ACD_34C00238G0001, partial [uncultured bacterium]